jgi:hypothetical protein
MLDRKITETKIALAAFLFMIYSIILITAGVFNTEIYEYFNPTVKTEIDNQIALNDKNLLIYDQEINSSKPKYKIEDFEEELDRTAKIEKLNDFYDRLRREIEKEYSRKLAEIRQGN